MMYKSIFVKRFCYCSSLNCFAVPPFIQKLSSLMQSINTNHVHVIPNAISFCGEKSSDNQLTTSKKDQRN